MIYFGVLLIFASIVLSTRDLEAALWLIVTEVGFVCLWIVFWVLSYLALFVLLDCCATVPLPSALQPLVTTIVAAVAFAFSSALWFLARRVVDADAPTKRQVGTRVLINIVIWGVIIATLLPWSEVAGMLASAVVIALALSRSIAPLVISAKHC